jgi:DNA replication protein DnaC
VPLADMGAVFLLQVIAERAEKATVIMTTKLPTSEWTQVIPNLAPERNFGEAQDEITTNPKVCSPAILDH